MQEVVKLAEKRGEQEDNSIEEATEQEYNIRQFIIEVIIMIAAGIMVILPFSLYIYHFIF